MQMGWKVVCAAMAAGTLNERCGQKILDYRNLLREYFEKFLLKNCGGVDVTALRCAAHLPLDVAVQRVDAAVRVLGQELDLEVPLVVAPDGQHHAAGRRCPLAAVLAARAEVVGAEALLPVAGAKGVQQPRRALHHWPEHLIGQKK